MNKDILGIGKLQELGGCDQFNEKVKIRSVKKRLDREMQRTTTWVEHIPDVPQG